MSARSSSSDQGRLTAVWGRMPSDGEPGVAGIPIYDWLGLPLMLWQIDLGTWAAPLAIEVRMQRYGREGLPAARREADGAGTTRRPRDGYL